MMKRRGFTLIELLVVIAIIAILAAILFPVFARARENARKTNCQSNLKQIGLAVRGYSQDYDERLPRGSGYTVPETIHAVQGEWWYQLDPYIKNKAMWKCPSDSASGVYSAGTRVAQGAVFAGTSDVNEYTVSYTRNLWMDRTAEATVATPASVVVYVDGANNYGRLYCNTRNLYYAWAVNRHLDGYNTLFLDGHVKWYNQNKHQSGATSDFHFHTTYHPVGTNTGGGDG